MSDAVSARWRLGENVPVNVYEGDRPVCQCHNPEDATRIVEAVNRMTEFKRIHDECHTQRDEAWAVLASLVHLKDGPRDERYRAAKDAVWDLARKILSYQRTKNTQLPTIKVK